MPNASHDENSVPTLIAASNADGVTPVKIYGDPTTHRLLVDSAASSGTVTSVSVVSTNGFAGTVATATTTPAITLTTTINAPVLAGNGTAISAATTTGSGSTAVLQTSPTLITPVLGVATATSINGLIITTTTGTLTIAAGKVLTASNTLTFTGTDNSSVAFGTGGTVLYTASTIPLTVGSTTIASGTTTRILYDNSGVLGEYTLSGSGTVVAMQSSPALITPALGVATATSLAIGGATIGTNGLAVTGHLLLEGVTSTGATGTGLLVFGSSPTFTSPVLGTPSSGTLTSCTGLPISGLVSSTSTALGVGSIELGAASDTTIARVSAGVISVEGVTVDTISATNTLTNKRITPRVLSAASYTTNTGSSLNGDTTDMFIVTAQTGALLFNNPSGTPTDGQKLIISVASSTTAARALTWDTAFGSTTVGLPSTTAATTVTLTIGFIWSASKSLWQCMAVA